MPERVHAGKVSRQGARSSVVNGPFTGTKERRSFKPKVASSILVGRMGRSAGKCRPFPFVERDRRLAGELAFCGVSSDSGPFLERLGHILVSYFARHVLPWEGSTARKLSQLVGCRKARAEVRRLRTAFERAQKRRNEASARRRGFERARRGWSLDERHSGRPACTTAASRKSSTANSQAVGVPSFNAEGTFISRPIESDLIDPVQHRPSRIRFRSASSGLSVGRGWAADRTRQPIFSASSMMIPSGPRT
jgi:hypothetical protein